ncbi:hypothetical protein JR316_0013225 [Psilocybe cubensis]|uniref:Uncharacterized protein n=2 Tax=Psilocybe cubensis TaxID=181762 RepID=A0ACB8GGC4_PSICU|nr:hypothetical protein JR316_0013225 [Psilocybe cubensis]KAH9474760.1 hypothetical protein JR316_0013225 [Psilocybe cubensis]
MLLVSLFINNHYELATARRGGIKSWQLKTIEFGMDHRFNLSASFWNLYAALFENELFRDRPKDVAGNLKDEEYLHEDWTRMKGVVVGVLMKTPSPEDFKVGITDCFTPYFKDLAPCMEELRQLIFLQSIHGSKPTHKAVIAILRKHMLNLPDDDKWSWKNDSACYGRVGGKRNLEIFQEEEKESEEEPLETSPSAGRMKRVKTAPSRLSTTSTMRSISSQTVKTQLA